MTASEGKPANTSIRRVGILFAGGPAPAANAVISTAAASFLRNGIRCHGDSPRLFQSGELFT